MRHPLIVGKDTWSQLEIDIVPWQILNRRRLRPRYLHDSLKELVFPELFDPEEKYVRSVRELWKEESRRRVEMDLPPEDGLVPPTDERIQRSVPSQGEKGFKGGVWDSTEMWEQKLDARIEAEEKEKKRKWDLRNIGRPLPAAVDPTGAGIWDKVGRSGKLRDFFQASQAYRLPFLRDSGSLQPFRSSRRVGQKR